MPRLTKRILTAVLGVAVSASLVLGVAAWFAGYWSGGAGAFQPGSNASLPTMQMWVYDSQEDVKAPDGTTTTGTVGWRVVQNAGIDEDNPDAGYIIPSAPGTQNDTKFSFELPKLHFGVVDNLISLKDDNIIYLRLTVTSALSGCDKLRFGISYPTANGTLTKSDLYNAIDLYGKDGALADDTTKQKKILFDGCTINSTSGAVTAIGEDARFLQIAAAVTSSADLTPDDADFKNLTFTEFFPIDSVSMSGELDLDGMLQAEMNPPASDATPEGGEEVNPAADENTEFTPPEPYYYIYLKIAPRLEFFAHQETMLYEFTPSHIFFRGKIEMELH